MAEWQYGSQYREYTISLLDCVLIANPGDSQNGTESPQPEDCPAHGIRLLCLLGSISYSMVSGLFDHLHVTYLIIYLCVNLGYVNFLHRKPTRAAQSKQQWWVKPIEHAQPEGRLNGWWCSWEGFLYGTFGHGSPGEPSPQD